MNKKWVVAITVLVTFASVAFSEAQETIRYNGSSTILKAIMSQAATAFEAQEGIKFDLKGKHTGFGIKKLLADECDIAGGGRPLKEDEKKKGLVETKLFMDTAAFIVHQSNPLTKIDSAQLTGVLKGSLNHWDDIGGPEGKKIIIISPPLASMHYKNVKKFIGFDALPKNSMTVDVPPNVYKKVKSFPVSIGWLSHANVANKKDVKTLDIVIDGEAVTINQANVTSGKYPYQQTMYFYTKGNPEGNVKKFIEFMQADSGNAIITEAGFFLVQ